MQTYEGDNILRNTANDEHHEQIKKENEQIFNHDNDENNEKTGNMKKLMNMKQ